MSDFVAGYISGAASIVLGSPLDILKVHLQARTTASTTPLLPHTAPTERLFPTAPSLLRGTLYPVLGYGALNALLFGTYTRVLHAASSTPDAAPLSHIWLAGAVGGLATCIISTPTEMIKTRAQLLHHPSTAREIFSSSGIRGFFRGGTVTAARDAIGYGFYFWAYEAVKRGLRERGWEEGAGVLTAGGVAGVVTWASIYPLDVVKTRVQGQVVVRGRWRGWREVAGEMWRGEGGGWRGRVFWGGVGVCLARAAVVNAVQWAVYEECLKVGKAWEGMEATVEA